MPPEIEALRLAVLSTRNPKKEKKPEPPIIETTPSEVTSESQQ
ncbi:7971_t:CDS:1, partial [Acaulospora colombiana]